MFVLCAFCNLASCCQRQASCLTSCVYPRTSPSPLPQMTKMLDLIESYLEQSGHKPCRIDGSMAFEVRPAAWLQLFAALMAAQAASCTGSNLVCLRRVSV